MTQSEDFARVLACIFEPIGAFWKRYGPCLGYRHWKRKGDTACVHSCLKAPQSGMLSSPNRDQACAKNGFSNWKNAMEKKKGLKRDESSDSHVEADARYVM